MNKLVVIVLVFMAAASRGDEPSQLSTSVQAGTADPDSVATALMPVPIYNFAVHNVAFSPNGEILATGNGRGTVRLWEARSGNLRASIAAHTNWAFSIAWLRDGSAFATAGGDNYVHLFTMDNLDKPAKIFAGHRKDAHAVVVTPDSQRLASAGDDRHIIVWNIAKGAEERRWAAHHEQIPTLALSPDGRTLASGSRDDSIRLWDIDSGALVNELIGHNGDVLSVRFSPDGRMLASAAYDHTVRLWDAASGRALRILKGHTNRVFSVDWSRDGKRLASAGDATVRVWDAESGSPTGVFSLGGSIESSSGRIPENLSAIAFAPDGQYLAVSSTTGLTFLISADTGTIVRKLEPPR